MAGTVAHHPYVSMHTVRRAGHRADRSARTLCRVSHGAYAALLCLATIAVIVSVVAQPEPPTPHAWSAVTVGESDSLWSIASSHPVYGLSTAETVRLIRESNGLSSSIIMAGQTLRVPADSTTVETLASR